MCIICEIIFGANISYISRDTSLKRDYLIILCILPRCNILMLPLFQKKVGNTDIWRDKVFIQVPPNSNNFNTKPLGYNIIIIILKLLHEDFNITIASLLEIENILIDKIQTIC